MAVTIVATVGGETSNSYVTLAEANAFFEGETLSTAWDAAADDEKNRALVTATRRIDQEDFRGIPVNSLTGKASTDTQALQWPRAKAGYLKTVIPEPIKRATMLLAYVLVSDTDLLQDSGLEKFNRAKVGPLEVDVRHSHSAGALPDDVARELEDLTLTSRAQFPMVRG